MTLTWNVANNNGLVASGTASSVVEVPVHPPVDWFEKRAYSGPTPVQFSADGQVYGHIAAWGTHHTGFGDRKVPVPRSACNYAKFATGFTLCESGENVPTGRLFIDTVHPNLAYVASDAQAHYADTGCAVADIAVYEDNWGIAIAGAVRPTVSEGQLRIARGSDWSGDWRSFNGQLELVAVLAVNQGGFIVDGLVASGSPVVKYDVTAEQPLSLVAAGVVRRASAEVSDQFIQQLSAELDSLKETVQSQQEVIASLRMKSLADKYKD